MVALDRVNGTNIRAISSKAYTAARGGNTTDTEIYRGDRAGTVRYKSNDRQYYAYGVTNQTNFDFATNILIEELIMTLKLVLSFIMIQLTGINILIHTIRLQILGH